MKMYKALHLTDDIDCMYQEKKEEQNTVALKISSALYYKESRTTF